MLKLWISPFISQSELLPISQLLLFFFSLSVHRVSLGLRLLVRQLKVNKQFEDITFGSGKL